MYCRLREKLATVRVSTAYEFYEAVRDNLTFERSEYAKRAKPPFEATAYILFYFAASVDDAQGKEHHCVLNRNEMWDCTAVDGSSTAYEFAGKADSIISIRTLPCPCSCCQADDPTQCTNVNIVSTFRDSPIALVDNEAPEYLQLPLIQTVATLKAFLRRHNVRCNVGRNRAYYVQLVHDMLPAYLLPVIDNAIPPDENVA